MSAESADPDAAAPKTAVLFQTHFFDRWAAAAFRRLRAGAPPHHDVVVLLHLPAGAAVPARARDVPHHVVRTPELRGLPYPLKTGSGEPWNLWHAGHTDLIVLHFCRARPGYDRYWAVEYDVAFSGPWRRFFAAFDADDSHLLAPLLCRRCDFPEWLFWPSLVAPGTPLDDRQAISGFMPIFRASGRLVRAVDEAYSRGWGGHLECTWATVAASRGLSVADLGGDTEFTPARRRGRFYSGTVRDLHRAPGTMVFKPVFHRVGSRPDMLWHPLKPFWFRHELRQALLAARSRVAALLRGRAPWLLPPRWREPGSFSGPCRPAESGRGAAVAPPPATTDPRPTSRPPFTSPLPAANGSGVRFSGSASKARAPEADGQPSPHTRELRAGRQGGC